MPNKFQVPIDNQDLCKHLNQIIFLLSHLTFWL